MHIEKNILPFNEFMEELRTRGFVIGIDHHLRVQKLLNLLGSDCPPSDMKYLLCPLFATDHKQQAEFYRIFERYFKPLERAVEKDDSTPSESRPHVSESVKISKIPYMVLGVLLFVLAALLYLQPEIEFNPPPLTTTLSLPTTTTTLANVPVTSTTLPEVTTTTLPPAPSKPDYWNWETFRWLVISGILIVFALAELYLYSRRRAVLQKQGVKRPPFVWTIETPESNFLKTGQFYTAARVLRRRLKGQGTRLDVKRTVTESLKAGYPKLKYKAVTRPPEYLILIDLTSYRDHYAHFFAHIADALAKENIFITRYFYRENPRVCFREVGGEQFYLSDLKGKFRDCRLILVGTGDDLLDPFTGELGTWTRLFNAWPDRAILTPTRPMYWGMREVMLWEKFIVLPATLTGLTDLPDYFEDPSKLSLRRLKEADAGIGDNFPNPPGDLNELRAYLGNEGFQWLCASAVYPELQWDLTLYLAQVCEMPERLPDEENLLRLIRLPWFREGNMPDDLRWKLIREMGETGLESVREKITELFEKNPPHRDSFAHHAFRLNVAMQDFVFSSKRKERRESRENLETVSESHFAQDYTLLRFLESAPKSGAALVLPERLRKMFYRNGMFVFGLKAGVRLLLALCLVVSVFVMTLPKNSNVNQKIADISDMKVTTTISKTTTTTVLTEISEKTQEKAIPIIKSNPEVIYLQNDTTTFNIDVIIKNVSELRTLEFLLISYDPEMLFIQGNNDIMLGDVLINTEGKSASRLYPDTLRLRIDNDTGKVTCRDFTIVTNKRVTGTAILVTIRFTIKKNFHETSLKFDVGIGTIKGAQTESWMVAVINSQFYYTLIEKNRLSFLVFPFKATSEVDKNWNLRFQKALTDALRQIKAFTGQPRFLIKEIPTEKSIDPSNSGDVAKGLDIGRESEVRYIIFGEIRLLKYPRNELEAKVYQGLQANFYLYDTQENPSERMKLDPIVVNVYGDDRNSLENIAKNIGDLISIKFPLLLSKVVSIEGDIIVTDINANTPELKKNTRLVIFDKKNGNIKGYARLIDGPRAEISEGIGTIKVGDGVMTE